MGTRIEDQPPEHWAGPESLDPTPVWKQFTLLGAFLVLGLVFVGGVALFAAAPQLVTPPALVAGDRLVLPLIALPPVNIGGAGTVATAVGPPLVDETRTFLLGRGTDRREAVAVRALWSPSPGRPECRVRQEISPFPSAEIVPPNGAPGATARPPVQALASGYTALCEADGRSYSFDASGNPRDGASRGLDRYLVSVSDDRVIVNLSRLIVSSERTSAPPTP